MAVEVNFKDYRKLVLGQIIECKLLSNFEVLAGACIAKKVDFLTGNVRVNFCLLQFETSVKLGSSFQFVSGSVLVGGVNDVAKCCGEGAIVLNF